MPPTVNLLTKKHTTMRGGVSDEELRRMIGQRYNLTKPDNKANKCMEV